MSPAKLWVGYELPEQSLCDSGAPAGARRLDWRMTIPTSIVVRRTTASDWRQYRSLRLEMLADSPMAFAETLANAEGWREAEWRMRAARGEAADQILLAAIENPTERWVGTMGGFIASGPDVNGPLLVGVYVTPSHRGPERGVASALLAEIEAWASTVGKELFLHVHEQNERAIAFYRRSGYRMTGKVVQYILSPSQREFEMVKTL